MRFTKSTLFHGVLFVGAFAAAVPAPEGLSTSYKAIARRANPTIGKDVIRKRADPTIGNGIDTTDPQRGGKLISPPGTTSGAFSNALELMSYVMTLAGDSTNDAVFAKYFNPEDKQIVMNVFRKLLRPDSISSTAELANINVISGEDGSDDPAPAALLYYADPNPDLKLSDDAFVYPNHDNIENAYNTWAAKGMTQDMYLLGSVLLYEYTHWDWFLKSEHNGEVIDQPNGYGWEGARTLDKNLAIYNADSYGWYATKYFWAVICGADTGYNAPDLKRGPNRSRPWPTHSRLPFSF